jgi:hypothetical protein
LIFEVCITETFEGAGVCDVSTRGICCCPVSVDEDCWDFEVREEDSCSASTGSYESERQIKGIPAPTTRTSVSASISRFSPADAISDDNYQMQSECLS